MPQEDGTGPPRSADKRGGRMQGTRPGAGPGGECICPQYQKRIAHRRGTPCGEVTCPDCGTRMYRG